ncbi:hypothetical protein H2199_007167 [Coniosporium tulheliwenetii]|uniref:Uncharacterized protein n=1 Tax=Coniosporium tulheliwenetii TaxID=3383036 RepID=A0ACC2YQK8_9PEZI|nr:hypothetical protein H2199_007167 [Cladosporium sp. JES 115]
MAYANGNKNIPGMLMSGSRPATTEEQFYSIELRHAFPHLPMNALNSAAATPAAVQSIPNPQTPAGAPPSMITPSKVTPGSAIGASRLDRQALLKDVAADKYYDPVGEVVKIQSASFDKLDLYLTDYTTNRLFYEYLSPEDEAKEAGSGYDGDPMNYINGKKKVPWPGPYGKMTLLITLWLPHADWARDNIHPGDHVCLKNVIVKYNEGGFSRLEGKLHQDRKYPNRVDVWKVKPDEPRMKDLLMRKEEYLARTKTANPRGKPESKSSKKQKRKEQRVKMLEEQQKKKQKEAAESNVFFAPNTHIRCQDLNRPLVSISQIWENPHLEYESPNGILQLPFINVKYRARVRVVDFWPDKLENFSQSLDSRAYNNCSDERDSQDMMTDESSQPRGWEWFFYIWVMDATQPPGTKDPLCLKLLVAQHEAVGLLKLDATDLRKDPRALAQLREKLFVLWGNLEELKTSGSEEMPTNTAFECCIKEYGVKVDDEYIRVHRFFGSTIM